MHNQIVLHTGISTQSFQRRNDAVDNTQSAPSTTTFHVSTTTPTSHAHPPLPPDRATNQCADRGHDHGQCDAATVHGQSGTGTASTSWRHPRTASDGPSDERAEQWSTSSGRQSPDAARRRADVPGVNDEATVTATTSSAASTTAAATDAYATTTAVATATTTVAATCGATADHRTDDSDAPAARDAAATDGRTTAPADEQAGLQEQCQHPAAAHHRHDCLTAAAERTPATRAQLSRTAGACATDAAGATGTTTTRRAASRPATTASPTTTSGATAEGGAATPGATTASPTATPSATAANSTTATTRTAAGPPAATTTTATVAATTTATTKYVILDRVRQGHRRCLRAEAGLYGRSHAIHQGGQRCQWTASSTSDLDCHEHRFHALYGVVLEEANHLRLRMCQLWHRTGTSGKTGSWRRQTAGLLPHAL